MLLFKPLFSMAIFYPAFMEADLFGKIIFLSLLLLSFITWSVAAEKLLLLKEIENRLQKLRERFHLLHGIDPRVISLASPSFFQLIEEHGLSEETNSSTIDDGLREKLQLRLHLSIEEEITPIEARLYLLSTSVTLAPFLGILGTVWGMLVTFQRLSLHRTLGGEPLFLEGISLALTTTAIGLFVAIPALCALNHFKQKINDLKGELHRLSDTLLYLRER